MSGMSSMSGVASSSCSSVVIWICLGTFFVIIGFVIGSRHPKIFLVAPMNCKHVYHGLVLGSHFQVFVIDHLHGCFVILNFASTCRWSVQVCSSRWTESLTCVCLSQLKVVHLPKVFDLGCYDTAPYKFLIFILSNYDSSSAIFSLCCYLT